MANMIEEELTRFHHLCHFASRLGDTDMINELMQHPIVPDGFNLAFKACRKGLGKNRDGWMPNEISDARLKRWIKTIWNDEESMQKVDYLYETVEKPRIQELKKQRKK